MPVAVSSTSSDDAGPPEAGLAVRVAAGPGPWDGEEWLDGLRRESLPESLLAGGTIAAAAAAGHAHKQERALNAEVTALCLVTGALFPVLGYDSVLALVFGMPGVPVRPGTPVPTGPAYSKARERHGEAPARAMFEADAARGDIPAGQDGTAFGLEVTQIDGTTLELFNDPALAEEFGAPAPGARPLLRLVGLLHSGTRRWRAAVTGRYLDGENTLGQPATAEGREELVLSALLQQHAQAGQILAFLPAAAFTSPARQEIFRAVHRLTATGRPVDPLTVRWDLATYATSTAVTAPHTAPPSPVPDGYIDKLARAVLGGDRSPLRVAHDLTALLNHRDSRRPAPARQQEDPLPARPANDPGHAQRPGHLPAQAPPLPLNGPPWPAPENRQPSPGQGK
jgi:hypothetical protein